MTLSAQKAHATGHTRLTWNEAILLPFIDSHSATVRWFLIISLSGQGTSFMSVLVPSTIGSVQPLTICKKASSPSPITIWSTASYPIQTSGNAETWNPPKTVRALEFFALISSAKRRAWGHAGEVQEKPTTSASIQASMITSSLSKLPW